MSTRAAGPATVPATMSEWPFRYFVALCMTSSKPCSAGRKLTGVAKVASIVETRPRRFANAATAGRSITRSSGFVIASQWTSRVVGRTSRSQLPGSSGSRKSCSIPSAARSFVTSSCVPP